MRKAVDRARIQRMMELVGQRFAGRNATVFLVGGTTLAYDGLKATSLDVHIRTTPAEEQGKLLTVLRDLKEELQMNIEEAPPTISSLCQPGPGIGPGSSCAADESISTTSTIIRQRFPRLIVVKNVTTRTC